MNELSVGSFLEDLKHPLIKEILLLRKTVLSADKGITEHIKWNAPSFVYKGDDRITMRLFPPGKLQVIFHRGVSVKEQPKTALVTISPPFIKWAANDRAVATFLDKAHLHQCLPEFAAFVKKWLKVCA